MVTAFIFVLLISVFLSKNKSFELFDLCGEKKKKVRRGEGEEKIHFFLFSFTIYEMVEIKINKKLHVVNGSNSPFMKNK